MENASKALIIAGAILLSILLIGLGMGVYNNASSTMGKADLSSTEIAAHNANFEAYEGRVKGSQVRTLVNLINKNNENYEDRTINLTGADSIKSNTTYNVTFDYAEDGLVNSCTITIYGQDAGDDGETPSEPT